MRTVLGVASYLCVLAMTVASAGTASANPDELPVQTEALSSLMLEPGDVAPVMGAGMYVAGDWAALVSDRTDRPECGSVVLASGASYESSIICPGGIGH